MLRNQIVDGFLNDFWVGERKIFVNFSIVFSVSKLSSGFLFVKVGAPNNHSTAFVGWFDENIFAVSKSFECRPFFSGEVRIFNVPIEIKFPNVWAAFFDKEIYGSKTKTSPHRDSIPLYL